MSHDATRYVRQPPRLSFALPLDAARLLRARHRIADYLYGHGVDADDVGDVVLAVQEAMTNAVRHSGMDGTLDVVLGFDGAHVWAEVKDRGRGFDISTFDPRSRPDPLRPDGRGLYLIFQLMDEVDLKPSRGTSSRGFHVLMRKRLAVADASPGHHGLAISDGGIIRSPADYRERRERSLVEEVPEGFAALDWEYTFTYANRLALDLYRLRADEVLGHGLWQLFPHIAGTPLAQAFRDAMELGIPSILEHESPVTDHTLEFRIYPTSSGISFYLRDVEERRRKDAAGRRGVLNVAFDITDHVRTEAALRESEERYRQLVENANSAILRWSHDGAIVFMNEYAQRLFGWSLEEAAGRPVSILIPELDSSGADLSSLTRDIVAHPEDYVSTVNENVTRDGRRLWMTWTNRAILDEHGEIAEILAVGNDISALRAAEFTLAESSRLSAALNEVDKLIHATLDVKAILQGALDQAVGTLGRTAGTIELQEKDGWRVSYQCGLDDADIGMLLSDEEALVASAARAQRAPLTLIAPDPRLAVGFVGAHGFGAALAVPLQAGAQVIGCLLLLDREARAFERQEIDFAEKLGVTASLALQNALQYDARVQAEHQARAEAETSSTLLRATEALTASMDLSEVLGRLARLVLEVGGHSRVAISLWDDTRRCVETVTSLGESPVPVGTCAPLDRLSEPAQQAIKDRGATLIDYDALAPGNRGLGDVVTSHLALDVPLYSHDRFIGLLATDDPGGRREFSEREIRFIAGIASQAAVAIENARLYEEQHRIATTLQENLLHALPSVEGIELAVRSLPATRPELVGGDFSDVFVLPDGRVALAIGDVAGKGIRAAGLTETVRSTLRAFATVDAAPAFIMRKTNELLLRYDADEPHVTALLCIVDVRSGRVAIASAGHPAPVLLSSTGADNVDLQFGIPLGSLHGDFVTSYLTLSPSDYLVLYTDGVTESRRRNEIFGEERLAEELAGMRGLSTDQVAQGIVDAARDFGGGLRDDVQVVVLRLS